MKTATKNQSDINLDELNELVIQGRLLDCRNVLENLNPRKISRENSLPLAELAVRVSQPLLALKYLHREINLKADPFQKPSIKSKMTYARALYQLGAIDESISMLQEISEKEEPEVLFLLACAQMFGWNYASAEKYLKDYLATRPQNFYRIQVVNINIIASYIAQNKLAEALHLLPEIKKDCSVNSFNLLLGNALELEAQIEILLKNFDRAEDCINQAERWLHGQGALYELYIQKWKAICRLLQSPANVNLDFLNQVRIQATQLCHWSTLRECDLFESIATNNEKLAKKVFFGTPYLSYRNRIKKFGAFNFNYALKYQYYFTKNSSEVYGIFDPNSTFNNSEPLYKNPTLYTLFFALAEDFYQPSTLTQLFKRVYPNEKFNPFSSPPRVMQLMARLNKWFKDNKVPLFVNIKKSEFSLDSDSNLIVILDRQVRRKLDKTSPQTLEISKLLNSRTLSAQAISKELNISISTVLRILKPAVESGLIAVVGKGRSSLYRTNLKSKKKRDAA